MIRAGAPEKAAWGVALGLTVTLVWLYLEILRLLSYFPESLAALTHKAPAITAGALSYAGERRVRRQREGHACFVAPRC